MHTDQFVFYALDAQRVSQRAAEASKFDDHFVAVRQLNPRAETQAARAKVMNMQVTGSSVRLELEVMMLDVGEAVAHLFFAGHDFL